jgi:serine/threonine protein kinase
MADNPRRRGRSRPESPRVFGGRWQVVKELGSGGQGTAFLVRDVNGENADAQYVLKQLRIRRPGERHEWQQKRLDRFEREIAALRRLDLSPNIPSVVDSLSFAVCPVLLVLCERYLWRDRRVAVIRR